LTDNKGRLALALAARANNTHI